MPTCELCGKKEEHLSNAIIEGTIMSVCSSCAKFGNVLGPAGGKTDNESSGGKKWSKQGGQRNAQHVSSFSSAGASAPEMIESIAKDWHIRIRKARENRGLKQDQLAKAIAEKESMLQKIESGHMQPSFPVARKLEQFLKIKLIEKEEVEPQNIDIDDELFREKSKSMTIGDLIKIKKTKGN